MEGNYNCYRRLLCNLYLYKIYKKGDNKMSYVSILAEKPSQAKAYGEAFNVEKKDVASITLKPCDTFPNGAVITWGVGHLVELQMPGEYDEKYKRWSLENLPIFPEKFKYKVSEDKKSHFKKVKKILKDSSEIVIATDIDREGEAIARLIINQANISDKPIKRLWINSLEVDEIQKGFNNLINGDEKYNLFIEAQSRQLSDWLIGMNLSPLYTLLLQKNGFNGSLGIGRVQSPTVYMIYQRQKEIENFVSKPFYQLEGNFKVDNGSYKGMASIKEEQKSVVTDLLEKHSINADEEIQGKIQSLDTKEKRTKSPKLHSLSSLQTTANKNWKISPSNVLKIVQGLYEKKIVSYPRTDCNFITDSEFQYIKSNIESYQNIIGNKFDPVTTEPQKRYVDSSKVEEHYAIIPTKTLPNDSTVGNLSSDEKNIYFEIIRTTLGMFHQDYIYDETTIITDVNGLEFKSTGKVEKDRGWKELFPVSNNKEKKETIVLPEVSEGEGAAGTISIKQGETKPPKPYTEGQLINMMMTCGKLVEDESDTEILKEVEGLGTEATRSGIIDKIKKENYIEVNKNIVSVTEKGKILCEAIDGTLLSSPSMTAKWELYLKKIGEGKASQNSFINNTQKFIEKLIEEEGGKLNDNEKIKKIVNQSIEEKTAGSCPVCDGSMIEQKSFYGCSNYKNGCKFSISKKIAGKKLTQKNVKDLLEKGSTSKIKGFTSSKSDKKYDAKLIIKDKKVTFDFD